MTKTAAAMDAGLSRRSPRRVDVRAHGVGSAGTAPARPAPDPIEQVSRPLIRPAPRSAIFFPLVILMAVLPGLVALNSWDLTPPGPLWGLRALAVLDGMVGDQVPAASAIKPSGEAAAFRAISFQPPLYAWLAAAGMGLSADRDPLGSVLPSYVAGACVVLMVYWHGRLWRGGGLGLAAALLVGFNPNLVLKMQEATPTTLALAGAMGALLCYGWHLRAANESLRIRPWMTPLFWAALGGVSLGLSLLSLGAFGLLVIPIVILHQISLGGGTSLHPVARPPRRRSWRVSRLLRPGWGDALLAMSIALLLAFPWHVYMLLIYGWESLAALGYPSWGAPGTQGSLLARLFELVPATLPLGIYGAARSIRLALIDEDRSPEAVGGALWFLWLAVAALAPVFWPAGPRAAMDLFLVVPLNLLAALTVADLVNRRIPVRTLIILAPATAMSLSWWASEDLRGAVSDVIHGRASTGTALGVHLAFDLLLASFVLTRRLDRWARRRDDRQRLVLAVFLLAILAITVGTGIQEVVFRHSETHELLALRTMILRRNREHPFEHIMVVRSEPGDAAPMNLTGMAETPRPDVSYSGGWLRFILRTALPELPQRDVNSVDELLALPDGQRLIIFTGAGERLSYPVKSKLGVEAIHPGRSGILDAYATAQDRTARR